MADSSPLRAYGRIGWLLITIALAAALVAGLWVNYRGARDASSTLNRGQADLIQAAVRDEFMQQGAVADDTLLRRVLDRHDATGLRHIALLDTAGAVTASVGESLLRLERVSEPASSGPRPLEQTRNRLRVFMPRPFPRSAPRELEPPPVMRRAAENARRTGPPLRRQIVLEIEPVLATALMQRAERSLLLAVIGATILTLAAFLFWRTSEQYARARLRLEEQRRLTQLGEMSAVLAHEIRNPLASLKGNAQLLAERLTESRDRARIDRVVAEATRLECLTSDLLGFARSAPAEIESASPEAVLRVAVADVGDGIDVDADAAPHAWRFDPTRTRHALTNILQNAKQVTANAHPPVASIRSVHDTLIFEVRDFGPGIPTGSETRIFDPFFTTRTQGTGLGLSVASRVVEMHGGSIRAMNHPEGGAVFTIELPRA